MNIQYIKATSFFTAALFLCSCASNQIDDFSASGDIGFIGDYSMFEPVPNDSDLRTYRYASAALKSGVYRKVILNPVDFYPEAETTEQVHADLLEETKAYLDNGLKDAVAANFEMVQSAQTGAFVLTPRITAVKTIAGDIKLREVIPVGAVVALAKAATGYREEDVEVYMEFKLTDSVTREFIGGSVKQGKGQELSGSNEYLKFEDLKPMLDGWIEDFNEVLKKLSQVE